MSEGITFFRCVLCASVVSKWDIESGEGCPKCGNRKVAPSNLSILEKIVQMVKHPKLWDWGEDPEIIEAEFPGENPHE